MARTYLTGVNSGVLGMSDHITFDLSFSTNDHSVIENVDDLIRNRGCSDGVDLLFPGKVVVKCQHCGQWAARKTACVYCGAPVD